MRKAKIERKTNETEIFVELNIDGKGKSNIKTPIGFFTHMLETFAKFGCFDLKIKIKKCNIIDDQHHMVEDCGIVLGQAFNKALSNKKGISRGGYFAYPMDDSLALVAVDLGERACLIFDDIKFKRRFCNDFDTDLLEEFFQAFSRNLGANIAVKMPYGKNDHHKLESIFKAFGRAMKMACSKDV